MYITTSISRIFLSLSLSFFAVQAFSLELSPAYVSVSSFISPGVNGYGLNGVTIDNRQGYITSGEKYSADHSIPLHSAQSVFVSKPSPTLTSSVYSYSNVQAGYNEPGTPQVGAQGSFGYQFGIEVADEQDLGLIPVTVAGYAVSRLHIGRTGASNDFAGNVVDATWGFMTGGYDKYGNSLNFSIGNSSRLYELSSWLNNAYIPAGFDLQQFTETKMSWINTRDGDDLIADYYGYLPFSFSFYIRQNEVFGISGTNSIQALKGFNTLSVTHLSGYTTLDPVITIGETHQNMGLSIITSPYMGNVVAAIPEPNNYVLFFIGLGLIGINTRFRGSGV